MQMYYIPWCPVCEKPSAENTPLLNLIQALDHLEAIGHSGIKNRFWSDNCDHLKNDTAVWLTALPSSWDDERSKQQSLDLELLKTTFGIDDATLLFISWQLPNNRAEPRVWPPIFHNDSRSRM